MLKQEASAIVSRLGGIRFVSSIIRRVFLFNVLPLSFVVADFPFLPSFLPSYGRTTQYVLSPTLPSTSSPPYR